MKINMKVLCSVVCLMIISSVHPSYALFGSVKAPKDVEVMISDDAVRMSWRSPYDDSAEYRVEIERAQGDAAYLPVAVVSLSDQMYYESAEGIEYDVPYTYRIRTLGLNDKTSKWIESDTVMLPKPTYESIGEWSISLTNDKRGVLIVWEISSDAERAVVIERRTEGSDFETIATIEENRGLYVDEAVSDETLYTYRIYIAGDEHGRRSEPSYEESIEYAVQRLEPGTAIEAQLVEIEPGAWGVTIAWEPYEDESIASFAGFKSIEIERKINDGEYEHLAQVVESAQGFMDESIIAGDEVIGEEDGYEIRGAVYTYRLRYAAIGDFAASKWVETEPISFGFKSFNAPTIVLGPGKEEVSILVSWSDGNPLHDPVGILERQTEQQGFYEVAQVNESDGSFEDTAIEKEVDYTYRLMWLEEGDIMESQPGMSEPGRAVPPEYRLPNGIVTKMDKTGKSRQVIVNWDYEQFENEDPACEIQRSLNSRDYVSLAEVSMLDGQYEDKDVTAQGGSKRQVDGKDVLINVYKYRVRILGDGRRRASIWYESDDIVVVEPI